MGVLSTEEWYRAGYLDDSEFIAARDSGRKNEPTSGIWGVLRGQVQEVIGEELDSVRVNKVRKAEDDKGEYLEVGVRVFFTALRERYKITDTPAGRVYLRYDKNNPWGMPEGDKEGERLRSILGNMALSYDRETDKTPSSDGPLLTSPQSTVEAQAHTTLGGQVVSTDVAATPEEGLADEVAAYLAGVTDRDSHTLVSEP